MGRPRVIRLADGGEIVLKNVSVELADQIKALALKGGAKEEKSETPERTEFSKFGLGTGQEFPSGEWMVYTIGYDPATGEAGIVAKQSVGREKYFADERFKVLASEFRLV